MDNIIKNIFEELKYLNLNRNDELKNKKRFWINELSKKEQLFMELFLNIHKKIIMKFCIQDGMCFENCDKPNVMIINSQSFYDTKIINPNIFSIDEFIQNYKKYGNAKITKDGNLQLNKLIAIQRKGSGDHANYLQFKSKKIIINKEKNSQKMKKLSLFSCSGIAEYYLKKTNIDIVLANELLEERCKIYNHFYPNVEMLQGDIKNNISKIVEKSIEKKVEFIMATPPCQSFSNAGKKKN
jgi:hypothetical protein